MTRRRRHATPPAQAVVSKPAIIDQIPKSCNPPRIKSHIPIRSPTRPRLPLEVVEKLFATIEFQQLRGTRPWWAADAADQRLWVSLRLVCKDWNALCRKHGHLLLLTSKKTAHCLLRHVSAFAHGDMRVIYRETLPDALLEKLLPLVLPSATSLSLPWDMMPTKHVNSLLKGEHSKVQQVHVRGSAHGEAKPQYSGDFWKKMYHLHRVPHLVELTFTGVLVQGAFREFQASVVSPIRRLHLEDVVFADIKAVEHFAWPLVHNVTELKLAHVTVRGTMESAAMALLRILGKNILDFETDDYSMRSCTPVKASAFFSLLPIVRHISVCGADKLQWTTQKDGKSCAFTKLPASIVTLRLQPASTMLCVAIFDKFATNSAYLPNLCAAPDLRLALNKPSERQVFSDSLTSHEQATKVLAIQALYGRGLPITGDIAHEAIWGS